MTISQEVRRFINSVPDKRVALQLLGALDLLIPTNKDTALTAHAGGTQAAALVLRSDCAFHDVATVATAADSVALPYPKAGDFHFVKNSGAASMQVYSVTPGTIDSVATATGVAQLAGDGVLYICAVDGNYIRLGGVSATEVFGAITADSITGGDSSLGITGQAAAQGGAVVVTGGASSTAGNAGGAAQVTGGAGNTTGAGGAVAVTGGAGGNDAVGGSATLKGGAAGGGNRAGGEALVTGGAGAGTGAGGAVTITAGASGAGLTGNGGSVGITAGAAASTNGNGGSVSLTPGALAGTGVNGVVRAADTFSKKTVVTAMTTSATVTVAALRGGLITANQGGAAGATYTLPSGTAMDAAMPADFVAGDSFNFSICNISTNAAEDVTVAGNTGMVAKGNMVVASNDGVTSIAAATFCVVKEAANTYSFYRIS